MDTNNLAKSSCDELLCFRDITGPNSNVLLFFRTYPNKFLGVKTSPYISTDSVIITISLLTPATLSVIVFVLLIRYNSAKVMANATLHCKD